MPILQYFVAVAIITIIDYNLRKSCSLAKLRQH